MLTVTSKRHGGFTLVELLVGMVIGMTVLAAITQIMVSSNSTNLDTLRMVRFNQEMRSVMNLMTSDIRRAGFNAYAVSQVGQGTTMANPFGGLSVDDVAISTASPGPLSGGCIRYGYDDSSNAATNADGVLNGNEQYGFKLNGGAVQRHTTATACADAGWQALTDTSNLTVTALTFTLQDNLVCQGTAPNAFNGIHDQTVTITFTATSPLVTGLARTLTETVHVRNNRYQYFAAGDCAPT
ncbi:PilW family protein [Methylogaea oryzae]|uniref:Prepilin-type N-terminal cleavage/methylation domain-containing protein n=1 Tax=Methylogaea oryzae TaxID=1295382 RepID=A0A8D4VL01_9GAMM|nr:prepilin-type N-terminal cleavage/methylation domain-containing protein [Methylogaea oryzae]BBL69501.1 hypothetical protein MoryE10_01070 [Methylogaea oryzae]